MTVVGPIGQGPQGASSSNSRADDVIVALVQGPIFIVIGCLVLAVASFGLAYVSVHTIGVTTGLLDAWAGLVTLTFAEGLSVPLLLESLMFGGTAGAVLAFAQFRRRWRKHHQEWIAEALISPETLTALRYGFACLALNVIISMLAAWIVTLLGVQFPWPTALGGHGVAVLIADPMTLGLFGSGGGAGGGWDPEYFLTTLVFFVVFVSIAVAIIVALSWSGVGWLLVQSAPASSIGTAAVRGAVYGGSAAAAGAMMQMALTGKVSRSGYPRAEEWFFPALLNGIVIGAANGAVIVMVVTTGAALFGLTAAAE